MLDYNNNECFFLENVHSSTEMRISHLKKTLKYLKHWNPRVLYSRRRKFKCFYFAFVLFLQLVHSPLPSFLEFSWQEKQVSEVFLNTSRHSNLHILVCTFEDDSWGLCWKAVWKLSKEQSSAVYHQICLGAS